MASNVFRKAQAIDAKPRGEAVIPRVPLSLVPSTSSVSPQMPCVFDGPALNTHANPLELVAIPEFATPIRALTASAACPRISTASRRLAPLPTLVLAASVVVVVETISVATTRSMKIAEALHVGRIPAATSANGLLRFAPLIAAKVAAAKRATSEITLENAPRHVLLSVALIRPRKAS